MASPYYFVICTVYYLFVYTTTQCKLHECNWSMCAIGWKVNTTSANCKHGHLHVVPMCKLHVVAASCSNLRRWMLVPGPPDLQQLALVVFTFQPMVQILQLHSCNLHLCGGACMWWLYVMVECGEGSCIIYNYVVVVVVTM